MTKPQSWRLKLLVVTAATLATLAVLFVAGEITVRYRERHRETVPAIMPFLYYRHARLGYALVRGYNYFEWVHTNPQGFRGVRPVDREKTNGVFRILAVGGSTTFDSYVSTDSAAWPARLERWLHRLAPDRRFEVINAGVPGYNIQQDLIRLETELHTYRPDLVVLYQGHNDLFHNLRIANVGDRSGSTGSGGNGGSSGFEQRPAEVVAVTPWVRWLEHHSLLYTKLAERAKLLQFSQLRARPQSVDDATTPGQPIDDGSQSFALLVSQYLAIAHVLDLRVVVPELVQISGGALEERDQARRQLWQTTVPFATPDAVLQGYQHYNRALMDISTRYRIPFLPMTDLGILGAEYYSSDDPIHFNDRGADRFAEGLARRLLAANLLPDSNH